METSAAQIPQQQHGHRSGKRHKSRRECKKKVLQRFAILFFSGCDVGYLLCLGQQRFPRKPPVSCCNRHRRRWTLVSRLVLANEFLPAIGNGSRPLL